MSNNYDSILKEKKRYKEIKKKEKKYKFLKRSLLIGLLLGLLIIIISYIIYYNTILGCESLFINNTKTITEKYSKILNDMKLNEKLSNNYTLEGKITIDNQNYNYTLIHNLNKIKKTLSTESQEIISYTDASANYIKIPKLQEYYITLPQNKSYTIKDYQNELTSLTKDSYYYLYNFLFHTNITTLNEKLYNFQNITATLDTIEGNFNNTIPSSQYIKRFYFKDQSPMVEINLKLTKSDLDKILTNTNLKIEDNYSIIITMKNNAITNQINEIKMIIKNTTKNERSTIIYDGKDILITTPNNESHKISFTTKGTNFTLRYYKNQELYSILTEEKQNNTVTYNYQVINEYYNVQATKTILNNQYHYTITSNINDKESQLQIEGTYLEQAALDEKIESAINYQVLDNSKKQLIDTSISNLLFSNEH